MTFIHAHSLARAFNLSYIISSNHTYSILVEPEQGMGSMMGTSTITAVEHDHLILCSGSLIIRIYSLSIVIESNNRTFTLFIYN